MKIRKLMLAAFVVGLLAMLVPPAGAQEFFYGYTSVTATCHANAGDPYFAYSGNFKMALPAGSTVHIVIHENGNLVDEETIPVPVATNTEGLSAGDDPTPSTFPFTLDYFVEVLYNGQQVFVQTISIQSVSDGAPCIIIIGPTRAGGGVFQDGRLCHWDNYAVYTDNDSVDIYGIWNRQGYFVLSVSQGELDANPGADGVNTLIKSSEDGLVQVYRLGTSNVLQVHAGLDFVRFSGLPASGVECGTIDLP